MIILAEIYKKLIQCPSVPPEKGGIIGIKNDIVCSCFYDNNSLENDRAIYIPNVDLLNAKIRQWEKMNIRFGGMFHSHPVNQPELSSDDIEYILCIVEAMPANLKDLFFPIVLPGVKILSYKANCFNGSFHIYEDKITII